MGEGLGRELAWGQHGGEIPIIIPITKDGTARKNSRGEDERLSHQDVIEVKLQEGIDQFCVYGKIRFSDRGVFRMSKLLAEGYDYLRLELHSNRDEGGGYGKVRKLKMEILNMTGWEHGHLYGGGYDRVEMIVAQFPAYRNLQVWKVSKGFSDILISDIVKWIHKNLINQDGKSDKFPYAIQTNAGEDTIEATSNKMESFSIPFWSPAKTLNYLKKYALAGSKNAGYHCFFDLDDIFHFQSLQSLMNKGDLHELELKDIVNESIQVAQTDTQKIVKEYFPDFAHKEFYKIGLSGASAERFNWFKKKEYTLKNGYEERPLPEVNRLYEKEEEINNMFGFHIPTGFRGEKDRSFCTALVYNQLLTAVAAQAQTKIQINGITSDPRMKSGDRVIIKNKVAGLNENVEELEGRWFVRGVVHVWNTKGYPYRQTLALSRVGKFHHELGGGD